jgi:hypothetical protein
MNRNLLEILRRAEHVRVRSEGNGEDEAMNGRCAFLYNRSFNAPL